MLVSTFALSFYFGVYFLRQKRQFSLKNPAFDHLDLPPVCDMKLKYSRASNSAAVGPLYLFSMSTMLSL